MDTYQTRWKTIGSCIVTEVLYGTIGVGLDSAYTLQSMSKRVITELQVNRDPEQYRSKDNDHDISLFMALLTEEYGGDASAYWDKAF